MNLITRLIRYVKTDVWRREDPRIIVRKRHPGLGWTINLAAVRNRLRGRQNPARRRGA